MPDADELSGTEDMHDMDLDASTMDQDGERIQRFCATVRHDFFNPSTSAI